MMMRPAWSWLILCARKLRGPGTQATWAIIDFAVRMQWVKISKCIMHSLSPTTNLAWKHNRDNSTFVKAQVSEVSELRLSVEAKSSVQG